jgi:hypothetical protein
VRAADGETTGMFTTLSCYTYIVFLVEQLCRAGSGCKPCSLAVINDSVVIGELHGKVSIVEARSSSEFPHNPTNPAADLNLLRGPTCCRP